MNGLIMAGQLLLGLSILVILHELGHFLAARMFGIKVEKFYLFFDAWGVKLFSIKVGETEYGIGWLPLGGYVKIAGMIDESMDTAQMAQEPQPWEFRAKPAWQRLIVMLGGIIVNIIVGVVVFWMLTFKTGENFIPNDKLVYGVHPGIVGRQIGLQDGDKILAINGQKVLRFDEMLSSKVLLGNPKLTVSRKGNALDLHIPETALDSISKYGIEEFVEPMMIVESIQQVATPEDLKPKQSLLSKIFNKGTDAKVEAPAFDAGFKAKDSIVAINGTPVKFVSDVTNLFKTAANQTAQVLVIRGGKQITLNPKVKADGTIGVVLGKKAPAIGHIDHGFFESFGMGASKAWGLFVDNGKGVWKMVTGKVSARNISSPIGIAKVYGSEFDWANFWRMTGLLSMALAFMNLLPIPALDGGHVVFLLIEMVKGSPVNEKVLEKAQIAGFVILLSLMVFAFGNDILKIFGK